MPTKQPTAAPLNQDGVEVLILNTKHRGTTDKTFFIGAIFTDAHCGGVQTWLTTTSKTCFNNSCSTRNPVFTGKRLWLYPRIDKLFGQYIYIYNSIILYRTAGYWSQFLDECVAVNMSLSNLYLMAVLCELLWMWPVKTPEQMSSSYESFICCMWCVSLK